MYKYHILNGLNKENCTILNCLFKPTEKSDWKMGSTFNSSNAFGSLASDITLSNNGVTIRIKNIVINDGINPSIIALTLDYDYRIVLMKTPNYIEGIDYTLGDLDGDGVVTQTDADMCLSAAVGNLALTEKQFKAADVNRDGKIDTVDAARIQRFANGTISSFD